MRITPEIITELKENQVFVYGANSAGRHGAGAAKLALKWGAIYGQHGFNGATYGIPTKDLEINTLPIAKIKIYVDKFLIFAAQNTHLDFLVTEIGCGLANYKPEDISPLFEKGLKMQNIYLPQKFINFFKIKDGC